MFENRERSIFPHPLSAWWAPILLSVGWGPLLVADWLYPNDWHVAEGFGMGWVMAVAFPATLLFALSLFAQACRILAHLFSRPEPVSDQDSPKPKTRIPPGPLGLN